MGRHYAGILGLLAFTLMLVRGVLNASGVEATFWAASCGLFGFAFLGWITGQLADYLVRESVRSKFQEAMTQWEADKRTAATDS